jgi:hypothetical protein
MIHIWPGARRTAVAVLIAVSLLTPTLAHAGPDGRGIGASAQSKIDAALAAKLKQKDDADFWVVFAADADLAPHRPDPTGRDAVRRS